MTDTAGQPDPNYPPTVAKKPIDWVKQKELRQKQKLSFGKTTINKVQFHGTQHRG